MSSDSNGFGDGRGTNGNGSSSNGSFLPGKQQEEITLQDILEKIYRRKNLVLITFLSILTITILYTFLQRPTYEATSQVLIQKSKAGTNGLLEGMGDLMEPFESDERRITNEMDILQTNLLRSNVATQLLSSPVITIGGKPDTMEIIAASEEELKANPGKSTLLDIVETKLHKEVSFSNDRNSDIISISVSSHTPEEASHIANVYTEQYYDLNLSSSRNMATNVREFLQGQLSDTKKDLDTAENNLQNYMQSEGIVSLDDESKQLIEVMSTFEAQRDDVVIAEKTDQQVLQSYKDQLAKIKPSLSSNISDAIDPYITLLQEQIAKLQVNRDVALAQNPIVGNKEVYKQIVAQADSQIAELQRKLKEKTSQFLESQVLASGSPQTSQGGSGNYDPTGYFKQLKLQILEQELQLNSVQAQRKALDNIVQKYDTQFSKLPKQYIEIAKLDRTEKSKEKLFLLVQDSYQQAQIAEQSQFGYVQIVDPAVPPEKPVTPKIPLNLTLGVLLGLAIAVGWVFVLDYLDRSIKSPEDLEKKGLNVLGSIPVIAGTSLKGKGDESEQKVMKDGTLVSARLITHHKPSDPIAEAYRSLRTAIQYSRIDEPIKTLLVASALPREGKSTTVANIAITMAKAGLKTLLVDGDFRRPVQHKLFNCDRKPGLIEYLKSEVDLNVAVRKTFIENLFLFTTGSLPPNPSEVLGSDTMKATLEVLKASFDFVIFDSPPVVAVTDGVILSKLTDGVLFVTLANKTELDVLEKAYSTLKQVKAGIIGFVLNEFDVTKAYGAYYRYYRYYHYYGHKEHPEKK